MRRFIFATIGMALLGTITFAQSATYDFDRTADFTRLKRYAWVHGHAVPDELNHRRIVDAVNTELRGKGFVNVEMSGVPDVLVAYHASFDRDLQITGFYSGWGGYRFPANRSGVVRTEQIVNGTLMVDLVDARTRTIVWRGTTTKEVDVDAGPEKRDKNIQRAVAKLFRNFPVVK